MALDVGSKTIGIAITDPLKVTVRPLKTLMRENLDTDAERIGKLIDEQDDSDGCLVVEPLLGQCTLSHLTACALEVRIRHVHEKGSKADIAVLVEARQSVLQLRRDHEELIKNPVQSRVVEALWQQGQQLG